MIKCNGFSASVFEIGCDQELVGRLQETIASKEGWTLESIVDVDTALACLPLRDVSVVILSVMDESSHWLASRFLRAVQPLKTPTIVIHDCLDSGDVLELLRCGAAECLGRPVNLTRLSLVLDMLSAPMRAGVATAKRLLSRQDSDFAANDFGLDERLMEQIQAVAPLDTTVLITGETGSGKTRLSRMIHAMSPRKNKRFVAVNCGALSESLLESELFGHVRGAFTGADRDHAGKFAQCRDGTLLLDEIDTLSPAAQVKLLQVVEDRVFEPVGSEQFEPLRARLLVASNKDLDKEVAEGRFRSDLYYRLNVMPFWLPPLRDRRREITRLAQEFVNEFANHHRFDHPVLTPNVLHALRSYTWPGNIRELRNIVERAVVLSSGSEIEVSHLPSRITEMVQQGPDSASFANEDTTGSRNKLAHARIQAEREQLLQALQRNNNNRSKTAVDLGISRVALYKRLRKFQIL